MGRFRPHQSSPPPAPRHTVVACWVTTSTHPHQWTVTITPDGQEPLLLFVDPKYVVVTEPVTTDRDVPGQLKVHLLHLGDSVATILLPTPIVGVGTKLRVPKTLLASIPASNSTRGTR